MNKTFIREIIRIEDCPDCGGKRLVFDKPVICNEGDFKGVCVEKGTFMNNDIHENDTVLVELIVMGTFAVVRVVGVVNGCLAKILKKTLETVVEKVILSEMQFEAPGSRQMAAPQDVSSTTVDKKEKAPSRGERIEQVRMAIAGMSLLDARDLLDDALNAAQDEAVIPALEGSEANGSRTNAGSNE